MYEDLKTFAESKQGKIAKFVTKSTPFTVMVVSSLTGTNCIMCEYQIKIIDQSDTEDIYAKRDKYNHLLYEFERAETLQDLINAINFTIKGLREKNESKRLDDLGKNL